MIKLMIVDDSAVVRQVISDLFAKSKEFQIQTAPDPIIAKEKMKKDWPDVVILDMEMPRMDGLTFLRQIMNFRPTPVIICSSLTEQGAEITLQALSAGAFSIMTKPSLGVKDFLLDSSDDLLSMVKAAAGIDAKKLSVRPQVHVKMSQVSPKNTADVILDAPNSSAMVKTTDHIYALGTSTGGTQALEFLLPQLPRTCPAFAIVQHMPEKYTKGFALRLNQLCQIEVKEAENGDRMIPGRALIAPGGKHMMVKRSGAQYFVEIVDGPLVSRHKPSVDVLFRSVAKFAGANATGIIMTGMGDDGAHGMKEMFDAGSRTYAQDEASSIVFGMPNEAIKKGGVSEVISLDHIASLIR